MAVKLVLFDPCVVGHRRVDCEFDVRALSVLASAPRPSRRGGKTKSSEPFRLMMLDAWNRNPALVGCWAIAIHRRA